MFKDFDIPWIRIHDYLYEVGAQPNLDVFCRKALEKIDYLVPIDNSAAFFALKNPDLPYIREHIGGTTKEMDAYNQYYGAKSPNFKFDKVVPVNWHDYRHTEFVTDFAFPYDIGQSIIMYIFPQESFPVSISINRPRRSLPFDDQTKTILEFIQPHLSNYYSIYSKMDQLTMEQFHTRELVQECKLLSKREAEVAALLCQRLTMAEIATKLLISPRTVQTYVENIKEKLGVRNRRELVGKLLTPR
ncbi:MAG TPA: helix-turn-helix transcriptional regulator [Bacillota bacterium]|nr:helix-turn-helix transcriptional regulator [Bacillota bacterium]